jgi:hypothetical protein
MTRRPKNFEDYYDMVEPGADAKITQAINEIGENTQADIIRNEQKSVNSELREKEQQAVRDFHKNFKLQERLKRFLGEFSALITSTGESEKTKVSEVLSRLENGEYDDDCLPSILSK